MKKNTKSILLLVTLMIYLLLCLFNPNQVTNNILDYSLLFLKSLFPVSFIFFIISRLLIDYGLLDIIYKYLNLNSSKLYVFIISIISGFPSGAKYTRDLLESNYINTTEANQIIKYCHFPNPLFVLGTVSLILNDNLALKILIAIIISNFIIFIFNYHSTSIIPNNSNNNTLASNLNKAIVNSFNTIINIYGTSLFFYLFSTLTTKYFCFNSYLYTFISGLFDLTNGIFTTSLINNTLIQSYFVLLFISFGSISIHIQVNNLIANSSINYIEYLKGRIIGTIIAFIIFNLLLI